MSNLGDNHSRQDVDVVEVDKSVVVLGGFIDKAIDKGEPRLEEVMVAVAGYQEVEVVDTTPPLALAKFESPTQAMKFIRAQRKNFMMQLHKLWASENRSKTKKDEMQSMQQIEMLFG